MNQIRILGLFIQENGHNDGIIKKLEGFATQALGLFRRVALKGRGLKERSLLKLTQAYVLSRVSYATPFLGIRSEEKRKLDSLIRRCIKRALGLPISTSTEKLLSMGVHNTWDEIAEAVKISQLDRLSRTTTGRAILDMVGLQTDRGPRGKSNIPKDCRENLIISPLPRNMHPIFHAERREKRAQTLIKRFGPMDHKLVAYVDAASGKSGAAVASVVDGQGAPVSAATIRSRNTETAEELAIALACVGTEAHFIISDSKTAIWNFGKGRISPEAARVLSGRRLNRKISLIWTPAHTSVPGNEAAHELARALYFRVTVEPPDCQNMDERLQSYTEIVENYRLLRRVVPPPDKSLNNREAVAWRRLQAGNFVNPVWAYHVQKDDRPNDRCKHCGARGTLDHIIWECGSSPGAKSNINCREAWEALLRSEEPASQQQAIRLAEEAARSQDLFACF